MDDPIEVLKHTSLHETHVSLGARMVPFGEWEMPLQFGGILGEARAVRHDVGIFDVSHMGRIEIEGKKSGEYINRLFSSDVSTLENGRARYGVICTEKGGIIDDCILYRIFYDSWILVPNASNKKAVFEWLNKWLSFSKGIQLRDVTETLSMIAIQGPAAVRLLQGFTSLDLSALRLFRVREATICGNQGFIARTGYTGEDGFEAILPAGAVDNFWRELIHGGATPCGLGARDVLRLEAGLLLHGNDMDISTNPYEARLDRFVDADREGYVARKALCSFRDGDRGQVISGFKMVGRGIARQGYPILSRGEQVGYVTSGSYSPTLDTSIGLGYVPFECSRPGTSLEVGVRGRRVEVIVSALPFYSRS